jgi:hypothetical protein
MKYLPLFGISLLMFFSFGCERKHESVDSDSLAQYRDTLIGKFNGIDIDTLIAEPIDTTKERGLWHWQIYGKNNTVDTLVLSQRFSVKMIQEGDLDGNGTDEFGVRSESDIVTWEDYYKGGTWDNYYIYTFKNREWEYLIDPIVTYSPYFYEVQNNGNDVVKRTDEIGFVKIAYSCIIEYNSEEVINDTIIQISPNPIN